MAQHDLNIANQGFPAFRADLNDALAALVSTSSGATAPATTFAHQLWVDTSANPSVLKIRNADNDAFIPICSIDQTNDKITVLNATQIKVGSVTYTLPTADGTSGQVIQTNGSGTLSFATSSSLTGTTDSGSPFETSLGTDAGAVNTGVNNTFVGFEAGNDNTSGANNTAVGFRALDVSTTGCLNTAVGSNALGANTTGNQNVAVGVGALTAHTTADGNTAVGFESLCSNTTGASNTAVGFHALRLNTTGTNNSAFGYGSLCSNTTGDLNSASGLFALRDNTTGSCNTATGRSALQNNTTGFENTAVGQNALCANTTGSCNVAVGQRALLSNTTSERNVALGINAMRDTTTGSCNVAIGMTALLEQTTGCNNIAIGMFSGNNTGPVDGLVNITTQCNQIVHGNNNHVCARIKIAFTVTSDCRDKMCFAPLAVGLDFVRALKPTEYQFKQGGRNSEHTDGKRRYGFLAQEMMPLEGADPVIISADDPDKLQYTEAHLIPVLVKAIQELTARVEQLENA